MQPEGRRIAGAPRLGLASRNQGQPRPVHWTAVQQGHQQCSWLDGSAAVLPGRSPTGQLAGWGSSWRDSGLAGGTVVQLAGQWSSWQDRSQAGRTVVELAGQWFSWRCKSPITGTMGKLVGQRDIRDTLALLPLVWSSPADALAWPHTSPKHAVFQPVTYCQMICSPFAHHTPLQPQ